MYRNEHYSCFFKNNIIIAHLRSSAVFLRKSKTSLKIPYPIIVVPTISHAREVAVCNSRARAAITIRPHVIQIELLTTIRVEGGIDHSTSLDSGLVNFATLELPELRSTIPRPS